MGKFNVNASKRYDDSPVVIPASEQSELTSSPSSSNGRTFSYGNIETSSISEEITALMDPIRHSSPQQATLRLAPSSVQVDLDVNNPLSVLKSAGNIYIYRKVEGEREKIVLSLFSEAPSEKAYEAAEKGNIVTSETTEDGRSIFSGNKEFVDLMEENRKAKGAVLLRSANGETTEVTNYIVNELSEADQALLQNAVKIYLIYLKAMEDEQRAKKKSGPEETLFEPSSSRVDSHEKAEKNSFSIRIIMDPSEKPSVSLTNIVMKMIVDQMNADRKKKAEEKKAEERALEKSTFIRREVVAEAVKKELIKKGNIQSAVIKSASITINIANNKFLLLLVLKSSPNTVFRASPKQDQQLDSL